MIPGNFLCQYNRTGLGGLYVGWRCYRGWRVEFDTELSLPHSLAVLIAPY